MQHAPMWEEFNAMTPRRKEEIKHRFITDQTDKTDRTGFSIRMIRLIRVLSLFNSSLCVLATWR
jgi:hypothetical protein